MEKCCDECIPCCDFCKHAKQGNFEVDGTTGPIGCKKHPDEEHQMIAQSDGFCSDFRCFTIKEDA